MLTRVLADANVFFSKTLRDWLILLETHGDGPYKTYWSEDILAETLHSLRREYPKWSGQQIVDVREKITRSLEGGRVDDFLVDGAFPGRDANDQHVHAAAVACSAHVVLTADTGFGDIPADRLPYEVYTPDDLFLLTDDSAPDAVRRVAHLQVRYLLRKHGDADLCSRLRHAGCPQFAERVRRHLQTMDVSTDLPPS